MTTSRIYAVILAAGLSSRMGTAKQLLTLQGVPMLEHVVRQRLKEPFEKVIVILGHEEAAIRTAITIKTPRLEWLRHTRYEEGQTSSLMKGFSVIPEDVDSVMIFLADQPFIKSETIKTVIDEGEIKAKELTTPFTMRPYYRGMPGHPVYWGHIHSPDMPYHAACKGDKGGLRMMQHIEQYCIQVTDPFVVIDIDTPADYKQAKKGAYDLTST
ncbi:nucleotidyltransferase family protein [Salipaludibacillus agaradhaerens]|uniref:nucleotidyltransferase family protein n=1 Tax=Salipaludibacillus agaradhaerens TaxID=76935 RepID=UPI0021518E3F|nr:nucleotidyltransferase family protein [Salipaludibacillus agaradhaerens]MCR6105502.1 nucleotidyltransferase family protein [Salipaludibacillus agaradhaerens]MCR6117540.1 nucleotidyltransferase family protein [Salipaludibacillus agaradhaerens]